MAQPNFDRAWLSLHVLLQAVFNEEKLLNAPDWKVFVGIADYLKTPQIPNEFKDKARAEKLGVAARYGIGVFSDPIAVTDSGTGWFNFALPKSFDSTKKKDAGAACVLFQTPRRPGIGWRG